MKTRQSKNLDTQRKTHSPRQGPCFAENLHLALASLNAAEKKLSIRVRSFTSDFLQELPGFCLVGFTACHRRPQRTCVPMLKGGA